MKAEIDIGIIQKVADSLDLPADTLEKNKGACVHLTELFNTSPYSGREKPSMIRARVALAGDLLGSLHRHEIDKFIGSNPDFALSLSAMLDDEEVRGALDTLHRRCNEAVQNGGSERLGQS